jgi:sec-independent protein translocase protein TatB
MSVAELLLTLIIALIVFGPKKLPLLAHHLARLMAKRNQYKQQIQLLWQALLKEQQLQDNTEKALKADASYPLDDLSSKHE